MNRPSRTRVPPKRLQNEQVATPSRPRTARTPVRRRTRKTAVRPPTIVPKNSLSTQKKKLIGQLDTLVNEMTGTNQDLHDFIISLYDETSNDEFTMKLFGGKSIDESRKIIQKHIIIL